MRWAAGFIVLLVALLAVGLLGRTALRADAPAARSSEAVDRRVAVPLRQQPEQVKQAVEQLMQQARPMPDEAQ
ncbi:hypothetical protein JI739_00355 [Ramlibacter sp. AW1]|uniref:Uncharacterized protein n=1 Tax=Ramlibacter aurantiacus TaxID=2801330 RepID=A0A936ZQD5_9BURK|nr:hypothetical protein [Ramlibacter aurantiacus]MBL0418784.1 hypothetical protein [Ramlibacter aurantiacus]